MNNVFDSHIYERKKNKGDVLILQNYIVDDRRCFLIDTNDMDPLTWEIPLNAFWYYKNVGKDFLVMVAPLHYCEDKVKKYIQYLEMEDFAIVVKDLGQVYDKFTFGETIEYKKNMGYFRFKNKGKVIDMQVLELINEMSSFWS